MAVCRSHRSRTWGSAVRLAQGVRNCRSRMRTRIGFRSAVLRLASDDAGGTRAHDDLLTHDPRPFPSCVDNLTACPILLGVLDPAAPLPLYHQLASWLEERVNRGDLVEGDRVESEPELARRFGIGRPTVRQATELLVRRGLLERRRGAGTFVRALPPAVDLFGLGGTLSSFRDSGARVETRWLGPVCIFEGRLRLRRLHSYKRAPVVLEEVALDRDVFRDLEGRNLSGASLSHIVLQERGMRLDHARQSFRVTRPGASRARALKCGANTPLLHVHRELFFGGVGQVIEADLYCRTDELELSQTLKGDSL